MNRKACSIEDDEDNTMIVTGGGTYYDGLFQTDSLSTVTKFQKDGSYIYLPELNTGRRNHACGIYKNTNQQTVCFK